MERVGAFIDVELIITALIMKDTTRDPASDPANALAKIGRGCLPSFFVVLGDIHRSAKITNFIDGRPQIGEGQAETGAVGNGQITHAVFFSVFQNHCGSISL